jgi:hypothetical protein
MKLNSTPGQSQASASVKATNVVASNSWAEMKTAVQVLELAAARENAAWTALRDWVSHDAIARDYAAFLDGEAPVVCDQFVRCRHNMDCQ